MAYERKKQRAKDARIKLNEAIEDLAVAIDLAGSQSKERYDYVTKVTGSVNVHVHGNVTSTGAAGGESGQRAVMQHPLARLMDETIQQASTSKKWDRPSFISLSSTIIRSLNAQCEGLTREVAQLRSLARRNGALPPITMSGGCHPGTVTLGGPPTPVSATVVQGGVLAHPPMNGIRHENRRPALLPSHPAAKKQKLNNGVACPLIDPNTATITVQAHTPLSPLPIASTHHHHLQQQPCPVLFAAVNDTLKTPYLLKNIALFLDPMSLLRCTRVSRRWNSWENIFQHPKLWFHLCLRRFGPNTVRAWEDAHDEDEDVRTKAKSQLCSKSGSATNTATTTTNYMNLYRRMSERNAKPSHCPTIEKSAPLGGSTLDGLVGGWATLVDRSNGETSRSVLRRKAVHPGEGTAAKPCFYGPMPVVEIRLLVQNTGFSKGAIIVPAQTFCVDASTRRKGEKFLEVGDGDERFRRRVMHVESNGSSSSSSKLTEFGKQQPQASSLTRNEMCRLRLYESAVVSLHIHARGCSTTAKFRSKSKNIQILVCVDGTTRPLVITFHANKCLQLK